MSENLNQCQISASGRLRVNTRGGAIYRLAARCRDLLVGGLALIASSPLLLLVVISQCCSKTPLLCRENLLGKNGRPFELVKLQVRPPEGHGLQISRTTARATKRFIRKLKLDELPQLWSVVKGDMSLVGPPAVVPEEYGDDGPRVRLPVRPGITGLRQLSRVREKPLGEHLEYELFYLANRSFLLDLWLLWRTVLMLATGRQTEIRLAARLWDKEPSWRSLVPEGSRAIPTRPGGSRPRFVYAVALASLLCLFVPGVAATLSARSDLLHAQGNLIELRSAATDLDPAEGEALLAQASTSFEDAEAKLGGWRALPLRLIPGFNNNVAVPAAIAEAGHHLVGAGRAALDLLHELPVQDSSGKPLVKNQTVNLELLREAAASARLVERNLSEASATMAQSPTAFLLPPVTNARSNAVTTLTEAMDEALAAARVAEILPSMFGGSRSRKWILGAENNAELRGRGGYLGSFGVLTTNSGRIELEDFQPIDHLPRLPKNPSKIQAPAEYERQYLTVGGLSAWQNLLMSPDFPTGARLLLTTLRDHAGLDAQGVISVDPIALSYLLEVTGPIEVPEIPEAITSDNVVDWTLNRLYLLYDGETDERKEQLSTIADAVWERLLVEGGFDMKRVAQAISRAASERHLVIYSADHKEQALLEQVGIAGSVVQDKQDYLMVVGQNFGENKMDYYLSRDVEYSGTIGPDGALDGEVTITVTNNAPVDEPLPGYISGNPSNTGLSPGTALTFLTVFVPEEAGLSWAGRNGHEIRDFQNTSELGKRRLATYVKVAAGESQRVTFGYRLPSAVLEGSYRLQVQKQSTVKPDRLSARIRLHRDMTVQQTDGFTVNNGDLVWEGQLTADVELSAETSSPFNSGILAQLKALMREPLGAGR